MIINAILEGYEVILEKETYLWIRNRKRKSKRDRDRKRKWVRGLDPRNSKSSCLLPKLFSHQNLSSGRYSRA